MLIRKSTPIVLRAVIPEMPLIEQRNKRYLPKGSNERKTVINYTRAATGIIRSINFVELAYDWSIQKYPARECGAWNNFQPKIDSQIPAPKQQTPFTLFRLNLRGERLHACMAGRYTIYLNGALFGYTCQMKYERACNWEWAVKVWFPEYFSGGKVFCIPLPPFIALSAPPSPQENISLETEQRRHSTGVRKGRGAAVRRATASALKQKLVNFVRIFRGTERELLLLLDKAIKQSGRFKYPSHSHR